jgi:hypothetical protein
MQQETSQKLVCGNGHFPLLVAMRVVLPTEGDGFAVEGKGVSPLTARGRRRPQRRSFYGNATCQELTATRVQQRVTDRKISKLFLHGLDNPYSGYSAPKGISVWATLPVLVCVVSVTQAALEARDVAPQQPVPERKKFEVASIKECKNIDHRPPSTSSPDRLSLGCWPLRRLIGGCVRSICGWQGGLEQP